jgi:hypothetical protein
MTHEVYDEIFKSLPKSQQVELNARFEKRNLSMADASEDGLKICSNLNSAYLRKKERAKNYSGKKRVEQPKPETEEIHVESAAEIPTETPSESAVEIPVISIPTEKPNEYIESLPSESESEEEDDEDKEDVEKNEPDPDIPEPVQRQTFSNMFPTKKITQVSRNRRTMSQLFN